MPSRKQITFDLDTKALEKYYPSNNWRNAYEVIEEFAEFVECSNNVTVTKDGFISVSTEEKCLL